MASAPSSRGAIATPTFSPWHQPARPHRNDGPRAPAILGPGLPLIHSGKRSHKRLQAVASETQPLAGSPQSGMHLEEEDVMQMIDNLPEASKAKAMALWEENKRMRTKLSILESVSSLPVSQRVRALELLKKNQALRTKTGALIESWDQLAGTVERLLEAEAAAQGGQPVTFSEEELEMFSYASSPQTQAGDEEYVEEAAIAFWELGLSAPGCLDLVGTTGSLGIAITKAGTLAQVEVDHILDRYWEQELGLTDGQQRAASAASVDFVPSEERADTETDTVTEQAAPLEVAEPTPTEPEIPAVSVEEITAEADLADDAAPNEMDGVQGSASDAPAQQPEEQPEALAVSKTMVEEAAPADSTVEIVSASDVSPSTADSNLKEKKRGAMPMPTGAMAAAAGLGAGVLAVAVGVEAEIAFDIMAATALVTSAGALLTNEETSQDLKGKGAGAPALVAIAATLNAADQLAESLDKAWESEVMQATRKAIDSATKMRAVASGKDDDDDVELLEQELQMSKVVIFSVKKHTDEGQSVEICGSCSSLGAWKVGKALNMHNTGRDDAWLTATNMPAGPVAFKFQTIRGDDQSSICEGSVDLELEIPESASLLMVECDWSTGVISVLQDNDASTQVTTALDKLEKAARGENGCQRLQRTLKRLQQSKQSKQEATASLLEATALLHDLEENTFQGDLMVQEQGTCVTFRSHLQLQFGQSLKVVGSSEELGGWDSRVSVPLLWQEGHNWVAETVLPAGPHDFKLIIANEHGSTDWEGGHDNRRLEIPVGASGLLVDCKFGDTGSTQVKPCDTTASGPGSAVTV